MHGRTRHAILILAAIAVGGSGCSRKHYRERADKDVTGIITQKNVFPEWDVRNWQALR